MPVVLVVIMRVYINQYSRISSIFIFREPFTVAKTLEKPLIPSNHISVTPAASPLGRDSRPEGRIRPKKK